jgi:predicted YcjX-like family ATPase
LALNQGGGRVSERLDKAYRARRFVLRFRRGRVHSFDVLEGEDPVAVLKRHIEFFPGEVPEALEEQFYDPVHPRRFRYEERGELLRLVKEVFRVGEGE